MRTILHTVRVHAAPRKVYEALTTEAGLSGWWSTEVRVEPGEGGVIRFTFRDDFHPEMRQTKLEPGRWVEWRCVAGHPNWQDNRFTFRLRGEGPETELHFTQEYARELPDEVYGTYNFNWGYYLHSLKQLAESGTGTPFVPPG